MEERSASDPFHASVLESLGFWVPTVVAHGRAFPGFPEAALARELGIDVPVKSLEETLDSIESTESVFRILLAFVPHISESMRDVRLAPERDRPFSQWVWHIFRFADEVIDALRTSSMLKEKMREMSLREYWVQELDFPTFVAIADYGEAALQRLSTWRQTLDEASLGTLIDTPWGLLPLDAVVMHLLRHSAIHVRQLVDKLMESAPETRGLPTSDELVTVPEYRTLEVD